SCCLSHVKTALGSAILTSVGTAACRNIEAPAPIRLPARRKPPDTTPEPTLATFDQNLCFCPCFSLYSSSPCSTSTSSNQWFFSTCPISWPSTYASCASLAPS